MSAINSVENPLPSMDWAYNLVAGTPTRNKVSLVAATVFFALTLMAFYNFPIIPAAYREVAFTVGLVGLVALLHIGSWAEGYFKGKADGAGDPSIFDRYLRG